MIKRCNQKSTKQWSKEKLKSAISIEVELMQSKTEHEEPIMASFSSCSMLNWECWSFITVSSQSFAIQTKTKRSKWIQTLFSVVPSQKKNKTGNCWWAKTDDTCKRFSQLLSPETLVWKHKKSWRLRKFERISLHQKVVFRYESYCCYGFCPKKYQLRIKGRRKEHSKEVQIVPRRNIGKIDKKWGNTKQHLQIADSEQRIRVVNSKNTKKSLSCFYPKRIEAAKIIHTLPLNI